MMVSNEDYQLHVRIPRDVLQVFEKVCKEADISKQQFALNCIEDGLSDLELLEKMGLPVRRLMKIRKVLIRSGFMAADKEVAALKTRPAG